VKKEKRLKRLASVPLLLLLLASSSLPLLVYPVKAADEPANTDAQIKSITFLNPVSIGSTISIDVTVQNYACGILGADLVVILKSNKRIITKDNRVNLFSFFIGYEQ